MSHVGCPNFMRKYGGVFSPVRVAYRTKYAYSNAHGASASPRACLRYTSETITGADIKAKVFSRQRKYIRQTNDVSDQRKMFAVAGATFDGAVAKDDGTRAWLLARGDFCKSPSSFFTCLPVLCGGGTSAPANKNLQKRFWRGGMGECLSLKKALPRKHKL